MGHDATSAWPVSGQSKEGGDDAGHEIRATAPSIFRSVTYLHHKRLQWGLLFIKRICTYCWVVFQVRI